MRALDLAGQRFGRWLVLAKAERLPGYKESCWLCRCDCGTERVVGGGNLRGKKSFGCGCILAEVNRARLTTHGHSSGGMCSQEYRSWSSMIDRCTNENTPSFAHYGGRGIRVCERWQKFENFFADMGPRPSSGHSLDRIDVNGNYEPGNCRWATAKEQARNRRKTIMVTRDGETMSLGDWCDRLGVRYGMVQQRIWKGMDPAKALDLPSRFGRLIHGHTPDELARLTGVTVKNILWRDRQGWSLERMMRPSRLRPETRENAT